MAVGENIKYPGMTRRLKVVESKLLKQRAMGGISPGGSMRKKRHCYKVADAEQPVDNTAADFPNALWDRNVFFDVSNANDPYTAVGNRKLSIPISGNLLSTCDWVTVV